jgi:hypothetical protein
MLHRYWFRFRKSIEPSVLNLGCGVTAYSEEDALQIIREKVFPLFGVREVEIVVTDVDVSTLDAGHVIPNMSLPFRRGMWFPSL